LHLYHPQKRPRAGIIYYFVHDHMYDMRARSLRSSLGYRRFILLCLQSSRQRLSLFSSLPLFPRLRMCRRFTHATEEESVYNYSASVTWQTRSHSCGRTVGPSPPSRLPLRLRQKKMRLVLDGGGGGHWPRHARASTPLRALSERKEKMVSEVFSLKVKTRLVVAPFSSVPSARSHRSLALRLGQCFWIEPGSSAIPGEEGEDG